MLHVMGEARNELTRVDEEDPTSTLAPRCRKGAIHPNRAVPRGSADMSCSPCASEISQWKRHSCLLSPRAFFGVSFLMCALLSVRTGVLPCRHDLRPHHSIRSRVRSSHRFGAADQDLGDVVGPSSTDPISPCATSAGEVSIILMVVILMVANTLNDFSREQFPCRTKHCGR